jgi:hypothetical protein
MDAKHEVSAEVPPQSKVESNDCCEGDLKSIESVQDGSGQNGELENDGEYSNKPTKDALEANTGGIVPEQPRTMTKGSSEDIHNILSMDVGPDDNLASHPNEAMKNTDSTTSLQVQQSSFGRCIGRNFQIRSIHNSFYSFKGYVIDNYFLFI